MPPFPSFPRKRESSFFRDARRLGLHPRQPLSWQIYTGVTATLAARAYQHRTERRGFAARYGVTMLVHAEEYPTIDEAIAREKAVKKWRRDWKIELIERDNPDWIDRYDQLIGL